MAPSTMDHDLDRQLRTITVYMFVLSLLLGVPAGTSGSSIMPAFGTIPAFVSAVLGTIGLGGGLKKACVAIPFDSIMIAAYLGLLIPTWISMSHSQRAWGNGQPMCYPGGVMLATYATVPLMINLLIHAYCVARHLPLTIVRSQTVCPNCQHDHDIRSKFHFHPPSTIFPPSTIYTPEDDGEDDERFSHVRQERGIEEASTVRASSDIDGSTLWNGETRQLLDQNRAPNAYDSKHGYGRQV